MAAIYDPLVRATHLSAEFSPPGAAGMRERLISSPAAHPWLVAEAGGVCGYAYATSFRTRPAYQWVAEVSVYVHEDFRRLGVARALYTELLGRLRTGGFRHAIAVIALPNAPSVRLHEGLGFVHVGTFPNICFKLGRWYDIGWWRLALRDVLEPPESLSR